jgi:hypothetical protein
MTDDARQAHDFIKGNLAGIAMLVRALLAISVASLVSSCISSSTIESHPLRHGGEDGGWSQDQCPREDGWFSGYSEGAHACNGLAYVLPRAVIKVSFQRTIVTQASQRAASDAAGKDLAKLNELIAALTDALRQRGCPTPPAAGPLDPCKSLAAEWAQATGNLQAATDARDAALAAYNGWPAGSFKDAITLTALPFQPDSANRFFARLDHSWIRNDQWTLGTTRDGFLTSSKAQPQDTTATILIAVANIANMLVISPPAAINTLAETLPRFAPPGACTPEGPLSREFLIDVALVESDGTVPSAYTSPVDDAAGAASINAALADLCSPLRIGVRRQWKRREGIAAPQQRHEAGLVYRRPLPYEIVVFQRREIKVRKPVGPVQRFEPIKRMTVMLPNEAPLEVVSYPSAALSTVTQSVAFENGFPTQLELARPGEAASFVKLPLDVLKALFALPASAVTSPAPAVAAPTAGAPAPTTGATAPPPATPTAF